MNDPWLFDILLAFKPIYINMDLPVNSITISDFLSGSTLNYDDAKTCVNGNFDGSWTSNRVFSHSELNHWNWSLTSHSVRVSTTVYNYLNHSPWDDNWEGWDTIWRLLVAPWVKTFFCGSFSMAEFLLIFTIYTILTWAPG